MKTLFTARGQHEKAGVIVVASLTTRSEEFRTHAAECQEIAERHRDLIKKQYEALARQWLVVAERAERQHGNLSSAIRLFLLDFYRVQPSGHREGHDGVRAA